jgi:hypothetical protein
MTELRLYISKSFTDITVREDANWPGMWRAHSPEGQVSDMANLPRAKEAAIYCARPRGLGGTEIVRWDIRETAPEGPPIAQNVSPLIGQPPGARTDPRPRIRRGAA